MFHDVCECDAAALRSVYPQVEFLREVIHNLRTGGSAGVPEQSRLVVMRIPSGLVELAESQDGVVTRRQALSHGMTADAIKHLIGRGNRWQKLHRGVYATFHGQLQLKHTVRAALLVAGPSAMVSGVAACRAYGMRYAPDGPIVVLIPHQTPLAMPGVEFRRTRVLPAPRGVHGIPCAPPERAVMDAVRGTGSLRDARAALCESVQLGLTTLNRLRTTATIVQRNDPNIWRSLDDVAAGCRSAPECEILDLIRSSAILPEPVLNQPLPGLSGVIPDGRWDEARQGCGRRLASRPDVATACSKRT